MKATSTDQPPRGDGRWAYEVKWDGIRAICFVDGAIRLHSRNLRDVTPAYPELQAVAARTGGRSAVLDGEIVSLDDDGRPSFQRLQQRMNLTDAAVAAARARVAPVLYVAFDLLRLDGKDLTGLSYRDRRAALDGLGWEGDRLRVPAYHVGDGAELLAASRAHGLEGLVAKRLDSRYEPGMRSRAWLKIKNVRRQELVVGGWLAGRGARRGRLGALLVGHWAEGGLRYAGRVGTGFSDADLEGLAPVLAALARPACPFRPPPGLPAGLARSARWTDPRLVVEVAFSEWTRAGTLRQPSYKGLRPDKDASEVVREG